MKISFKTSTVKVFAELVFNKLISEFGWEAIEKYLSNGTNPFEKSIKILDKGIKLTNLFYISDKPAEIIDLTKGGNLRYHTYPIFQKVNLFCYLSTQWGFESDKLNLDLMNLQKFVNTAFGNIFKIGFDENSKVFSLEETKQSVGLTPNQTKFPINKIYFGCPGTGKSYKTNEIIKDYPKHRWERVTFHPEYDYASFVGAFKPISTKDEEGKEVIKYDFVPQAFTDIYVRAWKDVDNAYFLLIEEINRGNCAEIFGDIFQLLDRNANYEVSPSQELKKYIVEQLSAEHEGIVNGLKLPPNLSLYATMNTSDQSLFPMDSAFKRRWEWKYVPIDYSTVAGVKLQIADKSYNWSDFLRKINEKIYHITESEDKQMGNFFVVPQADKTVSKETLMNKVLFYLWFDVFKHEDSRSVYYIFKKSENELFKYADLFEEEKSDDLLIAFMGYHQIEEMP